MLSGFFGEKTATPGIMRVRCPFLAFYGTDGDIAGEPELEFIKSCIRRQTTGPSRVNTVMIRHAGHMYTGEEAQVADTIAKWAETLAPASTGQK